MKWFIVANAKRCRIYNYSKDIKHFTLVDEFLHDNAKLKNSDLVSDKPGHYRSMGGQRGAYAPHTEPKEIETDSFARTVANALNQARKANQYNSMMLIAPPPMLGLINTHLDVHTKNQITDQIPKDYDALNEDEILEMIKKELELSLV
jgi:protein required for attachment to host cells